MKLLVSIGHVSPLALLSRRALPLLVAACTLFTAPAFAQTITSVVPPYISYQGKISNSSGALVGAGTPVNRLVIFRIWNHQSNGTNAELVYSEQQTVTISEGEFSVLIGQGTAVSGSPLGFSEAAKGPPTVTLASAGVFGGATRYLGVTIDDGTGAADPEVSPRQQMVTSAYAFRAKFAETVGSNGNTSITALDNGNVGIGTSNPGARLDVNGTVNVFDGNTKSFPGGLVSEAGAAMIDFGMNDGRFGTQTNSSQGGFLRVNTQGGVSNLFQFFARPTNGSTANEVFSISGAGNVGIGSSVPQGKLDVGGLLALFDGGARARNAGVQTEVNGSLINIGVNDSSSNRFGGSYTQADQGGFLRIDSRSGTNLFQFMARSGGGTGASEIVTVLANGNVGIGDTTPSTKLEVNGTITAAGLNLTGPLSVPGLATTHTQGAWLEWNKSVGGGQTYLLNQRGTGTGGLIFGEVDTANAISERMRIDAAGNVGIGTASPAARLHVKSGSGELLFEPGELNGVANSTAVTLDIPGTGTLSVWDNLVVSGNVGVGTTSPATTLDVRSSSPVITVGTTGGTNGALYLGNSGHGLQRSFPTGQNNNDVGLYTTAGDVYISGNGQSTSQLVVKNSGRVGIGTNSPNAPLTVVGGAALGAFFRGAHVDPDGTGDDNNSSYNAANAGWGGTTHSIVSQWRIQASALDVTNVQNSSDARIKRIVGRSAGAKDLDTLLKLEVTDYRYIDPVTNGRAPQKKVIAQQVEKIFPQAVSQMVDVIPDIYQQATVRDGWIQLATNLKVGERVRLISEKESTVHEVLEVGANRFRTAFKPEDEKVFVYGREVKDFRTVDYDAIAMLNVSATQEIKREKDAEVVALRAQNAELSRRVAELEAKDRRRDAKLAAIEKLISDGQTVMARPSTSTQNQAGGQE